MEIVITLMLIQGAMGAFDTIYHHELIARLPWTPNASLELKIHGVRNFFYAIVFFSLGWFEWHGVLAYIFIGILSVELILTLWDFVVEDQTRELPATERITHTLLALNYGIILAFLIPITVTWSNYNTGFNSVDYHYYSWAMSLFAAGVLLWAFRDLFSGKRLANTHQDKLQISKKLNKPLRFLVTGGSGFIGSRLCQDLIDNNHQVTILTRDFKSTASKFSKSVCLVESLTYINDETIFDVIINLAGQPLGAARWTEQYKQELINSRVNTAKDIYRFVQRVSTKPKVLINGSAIGYYGPNGDIDCTEESDFKPSFSHQLCAAWEQEAQKLEALGLRVCLLRTGMVLGANGGPLQEMLFPFQFGFGGPFGSGKQWVSWIHIDDLIGIIIHAINNPDISGPINGTAPRPVTNKEFAHTLGKVMHRPAFAALPGFMLRLMLGEMAEEVLLSGQRVIPQKALNTEYTFIHPELHDALKQVISL